MEKGTSKTEYVTKSGYGLHHLKLRLRKEVKFGMVYFFTLPMRGCIGASSDGISLSLVTCKGNVRKGGPVWDLEVF